MRPTYLFCVPLLLTLASLSHAQFVRPPVIIRPPTPVIHPPIVPHGTNQGGQGGQGGGNGEVIAWAVGGIAVVFVLSGLILMVYRWRKNAARRAIVRIKALPPGEAPDWVRQTWVGLELPLIAGQVQADRGRAFGVLSRRPVVPPSSYAVEGKAAIAILESASPEAAAWWRENAPDVAAPGFQLVFPADVCERLDDLGS
jgi:hypothetical protein